MAGIIVKPRSRIFQGHDWVYSSEVRKLFGDPQPGDVVSIKDFRDRFIGSGMYNPASQIVVRRFSRQRQDLDAEFFVRRLRRAMNLRASLAGIDPLFCRVVWSESDGLPGVVIDRYGEVAVLQTLTLAMDQRQSALVAAIQEALPEIRSIVARNDSVMRTAEGLERSVSVLHGPEPKPFPIKWGDLVFTVDALGAQKTGLYLDQFENYALVGSWSGGRRVLDCFCHQGGFAQACAKAGAASVEAVDSSASALAALRDNAERNGLSIEAIEANVFDLLKEREASGWTCDLVILDPPSFTRSRRSLRDALRGYKEIHLRALKLLEPGGMLVTFSCSHHLSAAEFLEMLADAASDAKRTLRRRAIYTQRGDHPILLNIPESEYLRGYAFEIAGGW
ncbi:MAG TPA: class I SAM-dependent rRNA methyltransferase [Verrucomicrobiales bacterium]|nr:class I SAM-dependent rRNA methyltransferase [Verrucomicrobiales bacterium]